MPPADPERAARRSASVRTAAILGSVALVFFGGIVAARYAGSASVGMAVLGFAIIGFLAVSLGRKLRK